MLSPSFFRSSSAAHGSPHAESAREVPWPGRLAVPLLAILVSSCQPAPPREHVRPPLEMDDTNMDPPWVYEGDDASIAGDGDTSDLDGGSKFDGGDKGLDGGEEPPPPPPSFSKRGLLEAAGNCAIASYRDFAQAAQELSSATQSLSEAPDDSARRQKAREAWRKAMASWQRAELFRIGPASPTTEPGGQGLRDQIYVYPLANYCSVDQRIVSKAYADAGAFPSSLASSRGLSAIEYLLYAGPKNACNSSLSINTNGTWAAIESGDLAQRRASYANAAAKDVLSRAQALVSAWDPGQGNFLAQLLMPGAGRVYVDEQAALQALSDAAFYVEKELKDWKLGCTLGLGAGCSSNAPESRYALASTDHIRQNLISFRNLFQGCGAQNWGLGFDDWLIAEGHADIANEMLADLSATQDAVAKLSPPIEQALSTPEGTAKVRALYDTLKALTDDLKTEFVAAINVHLPAGTEGDND